jgi:hypothetical protein
LTAEQSKASQSRALPQVHVYPAADGAHDRRHVLDDVGSCWCKPKREAIGTTGAWKHNKEAPYYG